MTVSWGSRTSTNTPPVYPPYWIPENHTAAVSGCDPIDGGSQWKVLRGVMWSDRCVGTLPSERWSDRWNCAENSGAAGGKMERNSEVPEIWRLLSLEVIGVGSPILPPKLSVGSPSSMQSSLDSLAWHSRPLHTRPSLVSHAQHHTAASLSYWQFSAVPCIFSLPCLFSFWALSLELPSLFCTDSKQPIIQGCL